MRERDTEAANSGTIEFEEADDLEMADVVLSGRPPQGGPRYLIIEASITVQRGDVLTAKKRAAVLQKVSDIITIPVVVGVLITEEARAEAPEGGVLFIQYNPGEGVQPRRRGSRRPSGLNLSQARAPSPGWPSAGPSAPSRRGAPRREPSGRPVRRRSRRPGPAGQGRPDGGPAGLRAAHLEEISPGAGGLEGDVLPPEISRFGAAEQPVPEHNADRHVDAPPPVGRLGGAPGHPRSAASLGAAAGCRPWPARPKPP